MLFLQTFLLGYYTIYYNNVSDNILAMAFKFGMTVDLYMAYNYTHARFDDLDTKFLMENAKVISPSNKDG